MKTIDNCTHKYLLEIGRQEDGKGGYFPIGNCKDCGSTINISDKYQLIAKKIYVLKEVRKDVFS